MDLPWQPCAPSLEGTGALDGLEVCFQLEELPANSYDLTRTADGGFHITARGGAAAAPASFARVSDAAEDDNDDARTSASAPAPAAAAVVKRPRAPALGPVAQSTGAALDVSAIAAAWASVGSLHALLIANLARLGYANPTRIQRAVLPTALGRFRDVVAAAETGSGKTAAYALPILQRMLERRARLGMGVAEPGVDRAEDAEDVQGAPSDGIVKRWSQLAALVIVPTRELAVQVRDHFTMLAVGTVIRTIAVVGGLAPEKQDRLLRSHPDVIVATPGRFVDVMGSGRHPFLDNLSLLQFIVLDEADRLVEKGSFPALKTVFAALQPKATSNAVDLDDEAEAVFSGKRARNVKASAAPQTDGPLNSSAAHPAADEDPAPSSAFVDPLPTYRRQTFLFSATLGFSTADASKDAARALVGAEAFTTTGSEQLKKKQLKRAIEAVKNLTPLEMLMRMVGVLGKPDIIRLEKKGSAAGAALYSGAQPGDDAAAVEDDGTSTSAAAPAPTGQRGMLSEEDAWAAVESGGMEDAGETQGASVALPKGLRLARVTVPATADKEAALYSFLVRFPGRTLVFVNSIAGLKRLHLVLRALKVPVHALHAHMQQRARLSHLEAFRRDTNGVLLATDVAARGLDVPAVEHVVHFSLPASTESFVHRSGRTARGERSGLALALIGPTDDRAYQRLCRVLGIPTGLAEFPSDANISREVAARVALARSIANEQASIDIESAQQSWLVSTAAAAGLEIDDATAAEVGGFGEALTSRKGARKPRNVAAADDADEGIGENEVTAHLSADDVAAARADAKARLQRLHALSASLRARLDIPLIPSGVSRKYVTSNPALGQAVHPMQALVHVDASGPTEAARSGSALVAPRVSMPDFGRGATTSRGSALGALKTGRHVHVPGVRAAVKKNAALNKARLNKEKRRAKKSSSAAPKDAE